MGPNSAFFFPPMKRRTFVKTSISACLGGTAVLSNASASDSGKTESRENYVLRTYSLKPEKQPILDDYLRWALLPALKRIGSGPIGVFYEKTDSSFAVHVLIVFHSADQAATFSERLAADVEHQKAGAAYLAAVAADPVYERIEASLLGAIASIPKLEKPDASKPRLLNLRIYESHNERAAQKKIEMFNEHELPIFRRVGLTPVFFGETLIGPRMPNLTYMLVFPDDAARKAAWGRFGPDPEWIKLKSIPEFADKEIVSHITNKILIPAEYSEI